MILTPITWLDGLEVKFGGLAGLTGRDPRTGQTNYCYRLDWVHGYYYW